LDVSVIGAFVGLLAAGAGTAIALHPRRSSNLKGRKGIISKRFLIKFLSIVTCLALVYLIASAAPMACAQEDLSKYLPTEAEMKAMFPWGQAHSGSGGIGGDPYRYGIETSNTGSTGEVARAYMYFGVQRWIDEVMGGSVTKNWVLGDEVDGSIELIQYMGDGTYLGWIRQHTVQEWREPELSLQNIHSMSVVVFQDVSVGDKSYAVSLYPNMDMSPENIDYGGIAQTKSVRLCFIKGDYYVQVHFFGASEKLLEAFGKGPPSLHTTTEPYPTEKSVITVDKVLAIARWVESKLSEGTGAASVTTASQGGFGSWVSEHPVLGITGLVVGSTVAGIGIGLAVGYGTEALLTTTAGSVIWQTMKSAGRYGYRAYNALRQMEGFRNAWSSLKGTFEEGWKQGFGFQPRPKPNIGWEGRGTVTETGDYYDGVQIRSAEDVEAQIHNIQNAIDNSASVTNLADREALKALLQQNKYNEIMKMKILDQVQGSHIGY
jgi:hypothetical protein